MGAWAEGVPENDAAGDWADELVRSDRHSMVGEALAAVIQGSRGIDACFEALAAVEVVAAGRGRPLRGLYEPLKQWLRRSEYRPTETEQRLALEAVILIRDRSELADEFGPDNKRWLAGLAKLSDRLNQEPRPLPTAKPARILPPEVTAAIERLDLANNSIELTNGGAVKSLWLCDHDDATLSASLPWLSSAKRLVIVQGDNRASGDCNKPVPITDAGLDSLSSFTRLEELRLSDSLIGDVTLARMAGLTSLKRLRLAETPITDDGLAHLSGLTDLEELDLRDAGRQGHRITSAGLGALCGLTKLRRLDLAGTAAEDSVLALVSQMPNLNELDLRRTKVTGAGLAHLSGLTNLENLELKGLSVGDEDVLYLARLRTLRRLTLSGRRITDKSLETIADLASLEGLILEKTAITDEGLQKIADFPKLAVVGLKGTDVTTEGARWLRRTRPGLDVQGRDR